MPIRPWSGKLRGSTLVSLPEQHRSVPIGRVADRAVDQQPKPGLSASQRPFGPTIIGRMRHPHSIHSHYLPPAGLPTVGVTVWFNTVYLPPTALGCWTCAVRRQINAIR